MADAVDISVVIVNWNAGEALARCVSTLHEHRPARRFDVTVVDNGSTDRSAQQVAGAHPEVAVVLNRRNRGLAAANNQGITATAGRYILLANPDVEFRPGAVDALADVLDRRPTAAWAVPRLRGGDGALQTAVGDLPTLGEALLGRSWQRRRAGDEAGFWWDGWAHDRELAVGHGMEACYLVRREALEQIGLQDERYPLDWEGIDWAARAADVGWEIWFCPAAEVVHVGGVSLRQVPLRWVAGSHRGMYRYFATRSNPALRPALVVVIAARALVKAAAVVAGAWSYGRSLPGERS